MAYFIKELIKLVKGGHEPFKEGDVLHPSLMPLSSKNDNQVTVKEDGLYCKPLGGDNKLNVDAVPISSNSGNLIERRKDGIFFGIQAPPNLSNLYADSLYGNDNNPGTMEKPFLTLQKAVWMSPQDKSNTIHLHAGADRPDYIMPAGAVKNGAIRTIRAYGSPYIENRELIYQIASKNGWYEPQFDQRGILFKRPVISGVYAKYDDHWKQLNIQSFWLQNGSTLNIFGIDINLTPDISPYNYPDRYGLPLDKRDVAKNAHHSIFTGDETSTLILNSVNLFARHPERKRTYEWFGILNYQAWDNNRVVLNDLYVNLDNLDNYTLPSLFSDLQYLKFIKRHNKDGYFSRREWNIQIPGTTNYVPDCQTLTTSVDEIKAHRNKSKVIKYNTRPNGSPTIDINIDIY